jgi:hypothetical protein
VSERTQRRVVDALADAEESDRDFAENLRVLLAELARHGAPAVISSGGDSAAVGRDVTIRASEGSVAAWKMGDVSVGRSQAPQDPHPPGRPSD